MSTAYHPQSDGQTEVVNKCLETYLRCMVGERPKDWLKWLPLAEWWYNTMYHTAIRTTPYQVVYGQPAPVHLPYISGDSMVEAVDRSLQTREAAIKLIQFHLMRAQHRMKQQEDKRRTDRQFQVGDYVYLKLQPYRQKTVARRICLKLSAKYYGPYKVIARVGSVAYTLELPPDAKVHSTFHVSQLKKHVGTALTQYQLPLMDAEGVIAKEPVAILDRRMNKKRGRLCTEVLVKWSNCFPEDATWENFYDLQKTYPSFNP